MADVFQFPKLIQEHEITPTYWRIQCPECDGTKWDNYVPSEDATDIEYMECSHCGYVIARGGAEE